MLYKKILQEELVKKMIGFGRVNGEGPDSVIPVGVIDQIYTFEPIGGDITNRRWLDKTGFVYTSAELWLQLQLQVAVILPKKYLDDEYKDEKKYKYLGNFGSNGEDEIFKTFRNYVINGENKQYSHYGIIPNRVGSPVQYVGGMCLNNSASMGFKEFTPVNDVAVHEGVVPTFVPDWLTQENRGYMQDSYNFAVSCYSPLTTPQHHSIIQFSESFYNQFNIPLFIPPIRKQYDLYVCSQQNYGGEEPTDSIKSYIIRYFWDAVPKTV